jgi:hypothetical protein
VYWIIALLALLLPALSTAAATEDNCQTCHPIEVTGVHETIDCAACHGTLAEHDRAGDTADTLDRCQNCHEGTAGILHGSMALREAEQAFVERSWGQADPDFYQINCSSCHVQTCFDCHSTGGHQLARPQKKDCHSCHLGYYVGADYYGMAPREDAMRYQRGPEFQGEHYLKMSADVHQRAGMSCGDCHSMQSLAAGQQSAKSCRDCHEPSPEVIEHRIGAHMAKLECYSCHSAWAAQEYGTFFVRFTNSPSQPYFRVRTDTTADNYIRSAYLRRQNLPPLGLNDRGLVSPIRPQYLAYFSDVVGEQAVGEENRLLAAEWKAFFPHTIQRGTPMCNACHDQPERFLLGDPEARIYLPEKDGLTLGSFWEQDGQLVINGSFYSRERFEKMSQRSPDYVKAYVEKWKKLTESVAPSSP